MSAETKVLRGLEALRRRPGLYLRPVDLEHLVLAGVEGFLDESAPTQVEIAIEPDGSVILDEDACAPTRATTRGESELELWATVVFGGRTTIPVVNALSAWLGPADPDGTRLHFLPDGEIFGDARVRFDALADELARLQRRPATITLRERERSRTFARTV